MEEITRMGALLRAFVLVGMVAGVHLASTGCKHCSSQVAGQGSTGADLPSWELEALVALFAQTLGKEEKAMFRAHSDACLATSKVDPAHVEALCRGDLVDTPELRAHVYCIMLKCKVVGKDGKLQKTAVLGKHAVRGDGKNVTKILENCADHQTGDTPEETAWNLFRCGFDKKAILFDYMPSSTSLLT